MLLATEDGLRPINEIAVGDLVLAYDETTHSTGLFTVTDVISHTDPSILRLTIDGVALETTAGHPFYTWERGWVDAGELRVGEHIHRANDGYGIMEAAAVEREPQVMYNLTVAEAHTFFVGTQRWLVHNAGCKVSYQKIAGFTRDVLTKGYHLNSDIGELSLLPQRLNDGTIRIRVAEAGGKTGEITDKVVAGVQQLLTSDPQGGIDRANAIISQFRYDRAYAERITQAELILEALNTGRYAIVR